MYSTSAREVGKKTDASVVVYARDEAQSAGVSKLGTLLLWGSSANYCTTVPSIGFLKTRKNVLFAQVIL